MSIVDRNSALLVSFLSFSRLSSSVSLARALCRLNVDLAQGLKEPVAVDADDGHFEIETKEQLFSFYRSSRTKVVRKREGKTEREKNSTFTPTLNFFKCAASSTPPFPIRSFFSLSPVEEEKKKEGKEWESTRRPRGKKERFLQEKLISDEGNTSFSPCPPLSLSLSPPELSLRALE